MIHQPNAPKILKELVEKHLLPLEQKVKEFDPRYSQTFKYEIEEEFQSKIDGITDEALARETIIELFRELSNIDIDELEKVHLLDITTATKELIEEDGRVSLFLELIDEVDNVAPLISYFILNRLHLIQLNENTLKVIGIGRDCNELNGERKAERLADCYVEVSERLYDNYVRMMWEFCQVLQGKKEIKSFDAYGNTIRNLKQHLPKKYHPLIDFDASWYRNALAHKDRRYQSKNNTLLCWNSKGKDQKMITICMNCLNESIEEKLFIAGIYLQKIQHIYLTKKLLLDGGVMRMSFELIKNVDFANIDEEQILVVETKVKELFRNIVDYKFTRQKRA